MHTIKNTLEEYSDNKLYQNINLASYIKISQKWNDIMGEVLSKICYPLFFRNAVLTIAVRDSVWANEIFMNRANIFKNIKKETNIEVVELKTREFKPQDIGQLELYVNYIDKNIKENHNKTIGLLIVKKKDKYVIEYTTNKDIFVTTYKAIL